MASTERQNSLLVAEDWTKIYQSFQNADFKSYDFETIRRSMIEYLRSNYPEDFNDYIESSEYVALIDMIAFLAQSLSFRIDLNARENFIDTAQRRESILRLARLVSYNAKRTQPAQGLLKVNSILTTENIFDANNTNLVNQTIRWNDPTNADWYAQFNLIINNAMASAQFGRPDQSAIINGIKTEQYKLNTDNIDAPVFGFIKGIGGTSMDFELVSSTINGASIEEESPTPGNNFAVLYRNDNQGSASKNSGWFLQFKQGVLQSSVFNITNPSANEIVGVNVSNINDSDVWLYQIETNGTIGALWTKLESVSGTNTIYSSLKNQTRSFYSVSTRENDQIDLNFSDGVFGDLPSGDFRLYYRISNGLSYVISPQDMDGIQISIPYTNSSGQSHTLTMNMSLQQSITNSAVSETNESIKQKAPQVYYTQNRMITGEDYNISPLLVSQEIVKVKSVNRSASGISRYFDINDPTGKYSNTNLFAGDGLIYRDESVGQFTFNYQTRNELFSIVRNQIEPLFGSESMRAFYYEKFDRIVLGELGTSWKMVTSASNYSTGFIKSNSSGTAVAVGQFTQSALRYLRAGALVKFVPPTGSYFTSGNNLTTKVGKNNKDYIWTQVVYVNGDGTNGGTGIDDLGVGTIQFANTIPTGAIPAIIIPEFVTDIPFALENEIVNQLQLKRDFGVRYDRELGEWFIITSSNLNTTDAFSTVNAGSITNLKQDSSWLISFETDGNNYIVYYRGLDFIFQSQKEIAFYFDENQKKYSRRLGSVMKDYVKVLPINTKPNSSESLNKEFPWQIVGTVGRDDGYNDNDKVRIAFYEENNDGIIDDPDAFDTIVAPNSVNTITGRVDKFIFLETTFTNGYEYLSVVDSSTVESFPSENNVVSFSEYPEGQLFYFYNSDEDVVKILTGNSLVVNNSIKAYVGRDNLKFQYVHQADASFRIDPAKTNIVDVYVLTKSYDDSVRAWINGGSTEPTAPDSVTLYNSFGAKLNSIKAISDEIIFHSVKYKYLFGANADVNLRAYFKIVKNPRSTANDNDIKAKVIYAINNFFSLEYWDFGDTFNFGELSAYVIKELSPDIVNFLIVPRSPEKSFGSLFQVYSMPDEIFVSTATVSDLEVIDTVTAGLIKSSGSITV